jgi:hypothetical protein
MLFEKKERTRIEPKREGEDDYSFYDSSARPEYDIYRKLINEWLAEMPGPASKELVTRFRRNESLEYQAALAELTIHAALRRQGFSVDVHPESENARKPDFLANDSNGSKLAFVEVTTFGPPRELVGRQKRAADVYNGIDKCKLPPGYRLGMDIVKHGAKTPSLRKLRDSIEKWVHRLPTISNDEPPSRLFEIDDWQIEVTLFGGFRTDTLSTHAIAGVMGEGRIVKAETEIRQSLSAKGKRYGSLDAPYLIAITDCKEELVGGNPNDLALLEALFGTVVTEVRRLSGGTHEKKDVRLDDGYWGHPTTARHKNVSGALLLPKPHLWDLRNDRWQPLLVRNPWADHPLPENLLPLRGYSLNQRGKFEKTPGTPLADILKLPAVWPAQ